MAIEQTAGIGRTSDDIQAQLGVLKERQAANILNAWIPCDSDHLAAQVSALNAGDQNLPLYGLFIGLKDCIETSDFPTSAGTISLKDHQTGRDAPCVSALRAAGAIIAGKTNLHELCFGITSNNGSFGAVCNPVQNDHIAGGSSGGSAAAVAAGDIDAALGTDTGGSVRIPAALCGVVGFRPTMGRYPSSFIQPISPTRDTPGPIARSVALIMRLDAVLAGDMAKPAQPPVDITNIRLGVPEAAFLAPMSEAVAANFQQTLDRLTAVGVTLVTVDLAEAQQHCDASSFPIALYEVMQNLPDWLRKVNAPVDLPTLIDGVRSPDVAGILSSQIGADAMPEEAYRSAMDVHRPALQKIRQSIIDDNRLDAVIMPTTPLEAVPIGQDENVSVAGQSLPTFPTFIRFCDQSSVAGLPSISLPSGAGVKNLPLGVMLDGQMGHDRALLAVAEAIEATLSK